MKSIKTNYYFVIILSFLIFSGCSSVKRGVGFSEVSKEVEIRSGQKIYWKQGTPEDEILESEIKKILARQLTVNEAVQLALLNNQNLQATYESLNIAQADLVKAGLLSNPVFDAEFRFQKGGGVGLDTAILQNFIEVLFLPLRKKVAEAEFEATKVRVVGEVINLTSNVKRTFYAYQGAEQALELLNNILEVTDSTYLISKKLRQAGNITELELAQERAIYEQSKLTLRQAEINLFQKREELNTLLGLWGINTNWKTVRKLSEPDKQDVESIGLEKIALMNSLELSTARWELKKTVTSLNVAIPFGVFPDLALGATAEREADNGEWGFGPAVSIPIPIFNQGQPMIASTEAIIRSTFERYAGTAVEVRSQVRRAQATLQARKDQVNFLNKIILPLKSKIVQESQLQYNAMQIGATSLLQAKKESLEAEISYIQTLENYWIAQTDLEQILSGKMIPLDTSLTSFTLGNLTSNNKEH